MMKKTFYYQSFEEDFFQQGEQFTLPADYQWIRKGLPAKLRGGLTYGAALLFSFFYCPFILHLRIKGAGKLRRQKGGFFLYGNHTQPIGDVIDPALACLPKRIYTVVSPKNLCLPFLGRHLPALGALPLPDTLQGMKAFSAALAQRIEEGRPIVIYPEAHLWPYYTGIRPFEAAVFKYPLKLSAPVYCATATYQKRRRGGRPRLVLYIDGPFTPEGEGRAARAENLRAKVTAAMHKRASLSNIQYIQYQKIKSTQNR